MIKRFKWVAVAVLLYALGLLCANAATDSVTRHDTQSQQRMLLAQGEMHDSYGGGMADEEVREVEEAGGEEHEFGESKVPELPNLIGVIHHAAHGTPLAEGLDKLATTNWPLVGPLDDPMGDAMTALETLLFGFFIVILICVFFSVARSRLRVKPPTDGSRMSRLGMLVEIIVVFFEDFFGAIVGKENIRQHLPLLGTLFIYIFVCNTFGLLWLGKAPTANLSFNLGMAIIVFAYVHFNALRISVPGYLKHYPGDYPEPKSLGLGPAGYFLSAFIAVLFTVIHVMEMAIQPISLSLRLYGNLLGKDVLLGVFGGLLPPIGGVVGIPLHLPFLFLGLLLGTIQALIFSLLTAVYITLWQPHVHHDHEHEHGHDGGHGHDHAHGAAAGAH